MPPLYSGPDVEGFAQHASEHLLPSIEETIKHWLPNRFRSLDPKSRTGSFNCAFFATLTTGQQVVIRLSNPATCDGRRFTADARLMQLIQMKTTIPMPRILGMDANPRHPRNPLGCRYLLLTRAEGECLADLWYNDARMNPRNRTAVLKQLAPLMLQLSRFQFDRLGDLALDPATDTLHVVPMAVLEAPEEPPTFPNGLPASLSAPFGPYNRVSDMQDVLLQRMRAASPTESWFYIFSLLAPALSPRELDGAPFVLRHPDLDLQNVFVDPHTFQITAVIDWDHVSRTVPRSRGFAGFPLWITKDWDPFYYGYAPLLEGADAEAEKQDENYEPTEVLQRYRQIYTEQVARYAPPLAPITAKSHISWAIDSALRCTIPRAGIGFRLMHHVFGNSFFSPFDAPAAIKSGAWYLDANRGNL